MSTEIPPPPSAHADDGAHGDPHWTDLIATDDTLPVPDRLRGDEHLTATDLTEIIAHCASTRATAMFRLMQAASLMYEEYEENHHQKIAEATTNHYDSLETFADALTAHHTDTTPYDQHGPDGLEQAIAQIGAVLSVPPRKARELILAGDALRYRLPWTGGTLAQGRIDEHRFQIVLTLHHPRHPRTHAPGRLPHRRTDPRPRHHGT
ncbi:hypothetical protein [Gordonia desulfuricans]|uniref:hypothetical protein n=1 Tax=Gordonia desulfuricans TaxID=89051 RepID=UPI001EE473DF|nr:hypothetical protein [Gordonia desulfuricans]